MAARAASRKAAAASGGPGCGAGCMGSSICTSMRPGCARKVSGGRQRRVPRMTSGTTGMPARWAAAKAPVWKRSKPGTGPKVALGEKGQGAATGGAADQSKSIARPAGAIIAGDEVRSDAGQQQSGQRHGTHLALDDEAEARRECRREHHAVQIAAVVGDDDTGIGQGPRKCTLTGMPISVRTLRPIQRVRRRACPGPAGSPAAGASPAPGPMNTVAAYRV